MLIDYNQHDLKTASDWIVRGICCLVTTLHATLPLREENHDQSKAIAGQDQQVTRGLLLYLVRRFGPSVRDSKANTLLHVAANLSLLESDVE